MLNIWMCSNFARMCLLQEPSRSYQLKSKISLWDPPKMLTTSSATASVARDRVPFDETNLQTHMCILILMKRDGTLFNVTSVLEEDIIEIASSWDTLTPWVCSIIQWWNLTILFQLLDDMQCTTCRAITVMVLCEEAIAIKASPLPLPMWGPTWQ